MLLTLTSWEVPRQRRFSRASLVAAARTAASRRSTPTASVACANVQFYSGRLVVPLNTGGTFLTIPGVAHAIALNCLAANAQVELVNEAAGTTDIWSDGDTSYLGTNWAGHNGPLAATGGATFHLGQGSGGGAKVITVTVSDHATGSNCIFQGTAEVITAG